MSLKTVEEKCEAAKREIDKESSEPKHKYRNFAVKSEYKYYDRYTSFVPISSRSMRST